MIGDAQLSYRLSRWTLLILMISSIPLLCIPVRGQEGGQEERPAVVATPGPTNADLPSDPGGAGTEEAREASQKQLAAGSKPDDLFLTAVSWQRNPSDTESIPTAWLFDRSGRKKTLLGKGAAFRVGDASATVEDIEKDTVSLRVNGKLRMWKLGMSFAAMLSEETSPRKLVKDKSTEAPAKEKTANDGAKRLNVQIEMLEDPKVLILRGDAKDVKKVTDLIGEIEQRRPKSPPDKGDQGVGDTEQTPHLTAYVMHELDPQTILRVLQTRMAGRPDVRMEVDPKTGNLIVLASRHDHAAVRETLKQLRPQAAETLKPDAKKPQATEAKRDDEPKLRFAFRYQKWADVLEWYADKAGLSLTGDSSIPGTFNYADNRAFTVTESLDLLNSVLLTKGYALLRRDRMLFVVNAADGIPLALVPRVTIEELGKRGEFELVSILFPLGRRDADKVRTEISPLLGACGRAVILAQTHQMLVIERGGLMRAISKIIESMPEP